MNLGLIQCKRQQERHSGEIDERCKSLCKGVDPDEHLEKTSTQAPQPTDQSPENSPVRVDAQPTCHTRSGRQYGQLDIMIMLWTSKKRKKERKEKPVTEDTKYSQSNLIGLLMFTVNV